MLSPLDSSKFSPMDDEEKILLARESERREALILKKNVRNEAYKVKIDGYNSVLDRDAVYLKVFLGFIVELGFYNDFRIMDALVKAVKNGDLSSKIASIMKNRCMQAEEIISKLID